MLAFKDTPQKIALDVITLGVGIFRLKEMARYLEWMSLHLVPGNIFQRNIFSSFDIESKERMLIARKDGLTLIFDEIVIVQMDPYCS